MFPSEAFPEPDFTEVSGAGNSGAMVVNPPVLPSADLPPVAQPTYIPAPSFLASTGAGMVGDTVTGDLYRHLSRGNYTRDFSFNAGEHFLRYEEQNPDVVQSLTKDQRGVLERTVNLKNFNDMLEEFSDTRLRTMMAEAHPVASVLGTVVDPIDLLPIGAATGVTRVFRSTSAASRVAQSQVTKRVILDRLALNVSGGLFLGATAESMMAQDKGEYEVGNVLTFGLMRAGEGVPELWKRFKSVQPNVPSHTIVGLESATLKPFSEVTELGRQWAEVIGTNTPVAIPDAASTRAAAADLVRRVDTQSGKRAAELRAALSNPAMVQNADLQAIRSVLPVPVNTGDDLVRFVDGLTEQVTVVGQDAAMMRSLSPTIQRAVKKYLPEGTRLVLSTTDTPGLHGFTTAIGEGVHLLNLNPKLKGIKSTDTLFHELGHIVVEEGYSKAPAEVLAQMRTGYDDLIKQTKSQNYRTSEQVVYGFRSIHDAEDEAARVFDAQRLKKGNATFNTAAKEVYGDLYGAGGIGTFQEWSAEQFVKGVQQELLQDATTLGVHPLVAQYAARTAKKLTALADDLKQVVQPVAGFKELLAAAKKEGVVYDEAARLAADVPGSEFLNPKFMLPNKMQTVLYAESWLGKGWSNLFDKMRSFGPTSSEWAEKLVVDATSTDAVTAVNDVVRVRRELGARAQSIEQGLARATGFSRVQQFTQRTKFREEYARLSESLHYALQEAHQATIKNLPVPQIADPKVRELVDQYVKSGFAEAALKEARESGLISVDEVMESPYYTPTHHSAASIHKYVEAGGSLDDVHKVYAQQFARIFSYLTPEQVQQAAKRAVSNITDPLYRGAKPGIFMGTTKDEIEHVMNNIGLSDAQMKEFSMYFAKPLDEAGKPKNFKKKLDWNVFDKVTLADGSELGIVDFMDKNVPRSLESYTRTLAGRTALARKGLDTPAAIEDMIAAAAKDSSNPTATRELFQHVVDNLLGLPTGTKLPDLLQSIGSMSAFISLRNMGLFNVIDTATVMHQHGILRTVKAMTAGGVSFKGLSHAEAQTLQDIVKSQVVSDGRWRAVRDFMDDGFAVPNDTLHEAVQHGTQAIGHLTGAEAVRKYLVGLNANLTADSLFKAVQGDAGMRSMLERFGLNQDLFTKIATDFQKHGNQPELWTAEARTSAINIMQNMSDHVVQKNRLGEIPAFFQFNPLARVLFPYMNFVAGAHNKILRRTYKQEGMGSLLMLAAYQVPMATMMAATSNILSGKEWDKDLGKKTAGSLPMAGWLGFAMDVYDRGFSSPVAMFAYLQRVHEAAGSIAQGNTSVEKLAAISPLAPMLGVKLFTNVVDELTGQHERTKELAAEKRSNTND